MDYTIDGLLSWKIELMFSIRWDIFNSEMMLVPTDIGIFKVREKVGYKRILLKGWMITRICNELLSGLVILNRRLCM